MMIRADRPASSRAKSALAIFKGDTRMYHRKEDLKRPFALHASAQG
jgi:hypothetical protein